MSEVGDPQGIPRNLNIAAVAVNLPIKVQATSSPKYANNVNLRNYNNKRVLYSLLASMVSIYWYNALSTWLHHQGHIPYLSSGDRATSKSTGMFHRVVIVGILEKEFKLSHVCSMVDQFSFTVVDVSEGH